MPFLSILEPFHVHSIRKAPHKAKAQILLDF